jgi:hypothetical protein
MSGPANETPKRTRPPATEPAAPPPAPAPAPPPAAPTTAAVTSAVSQVRARLMAGEQMVLLGAALIVGIAWFIFQFVLAYFVVSDFTVLVAVLAILAIWVHRWGHYDFGSAYRIVIGALGVSLALFAVLSLLAWFRGVINVGMGDALRVVGLIVYWVGGLVAGYGAWLVFRTRDR